VAITEAVGSEDRWRESSSVRGQVARTEAAGSEDRWRESYSVRGQVAITGIVGSSESRTGVEELASGNKVWRLC